MWGCMHDCRSKLCNLASKTIAIVMMDQSDDWKAKRRRNGTIVSKQFIKPSTYGKCYQCSRFSMRTAFYRLLIAHSAFTENFLAILIKGEVQTPSRSLNGKRRRCKNSRKIRIIACFVFDQELCLEGSQIEHWRVSGISNMSCNRCLWKLK